MIDAHLGELGGSISPGISDFLALARPKKTMAFSFGAEAKVMPWVVITLVIRPIAHRGVINLLTNSN
jgi:hypothetical protein